MYENRRRTHGWGARAVNVPARISLWLAVLFILTGMVLFAIEDASMACGALESDFMYLVARARR